MAMAHTGDRKLENVGNIGRAGPQREPAYCGAQAGIQGGT